jgi:hypothetical protein
MDEDQGRDVGASLGERADGVARGPAPPNGHAVAAAADTSDPDRQHRPLKDRAEELSAAEITICDIDRIEFDMTTRRPLSMDVVNRMVDSIRLIGLLTPIAVRAEGERARGVTGAHRHAACRQLGWSKIPVRVIPETMSAVEIELIEIDENLVRKNLDAAQEALAIERRAGLIRAMAEEQEKARADGAPNGAPSKQAERRAGKKTGPDPASTRDLAKKTGMSEGRINRARKRVKVLGTDVLEKVQGTELAKPGELDALAALGKESPEEQQQLIDQAKVGEKVSARTALKQRRPRRSEAEIAADNLQHEVEMVAAACEATDCVKIPRVPPELAETLIARVGEGMGALRRFKSRLEALRKSGSPDCPRCKGDGFVTVQLENNKEGRIECDCKNPRPRRPGVQQEKGMDASNAIA